MTSSWFFLSTLNYDARSNTSDLLHGSYAIQERKSITWLVLTNWGFYRKLLYQGDSFCLKRVTFQENRSDNKQEWSPTDISDVIQFSLVNLTFTQLMFIYLEVPKLLFISMTKWIKSNYQVLQSTVWFLPTCSIHVEILSDNQDYLYLNINDDEER